MTTLNQGCGVRTVSPTIRLMKQLSLVIPAFLTVFALSPCFAQDVIFKCVNNGVASYQSSPCSSGATPYKDASQKPASSTGVNPSGQPAIAPIGPNGQPLVVRAVPNGGAISVGIGVSVGGATAIGIGPAANLVQSPGAEPVSISPGVGGATSTIRVSCRANATPEACEQENLQLNLTNAIHQAKISDVRQWLGKMKDVRYLSPAKPGSPLLFAIERGYAEIVKMLLDKGADPLALDADGLSLLASAIERAESQPAGMTQGTYQCLRLALDKAKANGSLKPVFPLNAVLAFSAKPDPVLLKFLLDYGADPEAKAPSGYTATQMAFAQAQPEMLKVILTARPNEPSRNLDQMAYRAFVLKKAETLAMLSAAGGSHFRYAKNDPQPLLDALKPDRPIDELEFVLKAGANPNGVKTTPQPSAPIMMVTSDEDRLRLMLKYGADANTPGMLAQVLYAPPVANPVPGKIKPASKLALVQLLLDSGANPNGAQGAWGGYGALGNTRSEDKDVIALLLVRGATLADSEQMIRAREAMSTGGPGTPGGPIGGPVAIAIGMEREDLALALLARDKKIGPKDRIALPLAAQRGLANLVQALLAAGADPNATDERGWTALAAATRRHDAPMMKMLADAGAKPAAAPPRQTRNISGSAFAKNVASDLDDIANFDFPRFGLNSVHENVAFAFYGKGSQIEQIKCERSVAFSIVANANVAAGIQAGVCEREARHLSELSANSSGAIDTSLNQLAQGDESKRKQFAQLGLAYAKSKAQNGSDVHSFPVVWIGHGVGIVYTVVVIQRNGQSAVVVQADTSRLCEMLGMKVQTPLCGEPQKSLIDLALRIEAHIVTEAH